MADGAMRIPVARYALAVTVTDVRLIPLSTATDAFATVVVVVVAIGIARVIRIVGVSRIVGVIRVTRIVRVVEVGRVAWIIRGIWGDD